MLGLNTKIARIVMRQPSGRIYIGANRLKFCFERKQRMSTADTTGYSAVAGCVMNDGLFLSMLSFNLWHFREGSYEVATGCALNRM